MQLLFLFIYLIRLCVLLPLNMEIDNENKIIFDCVTNAIRTEPVKNTVTFGLYSEAEMWVSLFKNNKRTIFVNINATYL